MSKFPSGVVTGDGVQAIFNDAQENEYALPAVNVVGTNSVNAVLETAAAVNSPVIILLLALIIDAVKFLNSTSSVLVN